jgi:hypothetical protein
MAEFGRNVRVWYIELQMSSTITYGSPPVPADSSHNQDDLEKDDIVVTNDGEKPKDLAEVDSPSRKTTISKEVQLAQKKEELAAIAQAIIEDPEQNVCA